jgi:hypothetical protein
MLNRSARGRILETPSSQGLTQSPLPLVAVQRDNPSPAAFVVIVVLLASLSVLVAELARRGGSSNSSQ